jgi:hypothetical protein
MRKSNVLLWTLAVCVLVVAAPLAAQPRTLLDAADSVLPPLQLREAINLSHADGDGAACQAAADGDGLLLDPVFEAIENGPCSWCNSNSSCSTPCIDDNGNQSDCGDYGVCDPCREGIVEIGRVNIGSTAARKWLIQCEYTLYWQVTKQSVNAGCQPFTVCETTTETHTPIGVPCCAFVPGCFGTTCSP